MGNTYILERELGGGGMSRVFLATETALDRPIVLKLLPPELASAVSTDRFRQEIRLAARLQHPHIVPLLSAGDAAGLLYYTMPFVEGESLRARLARAGELSVREAVRVLRDVAAALAYAHEHGVVHRDVKPDNVLISGGEALVTDFGVAKALSASVTGGGSGLTSLGVALGTPTYMAPEQAAADPQTDHRADLYAWGCLAYECLTGQPPFLGRSTPALLAAHMAEAPEGIDRRRPALPPALSTLVMRCLEKRPADRPQSAEEVLQALDGAMTPTSGSSPTVPVRAARQRRWPLIASIGGGSLAVMAGLGVLYMSKPGRASAKNLDARVVAVLPFRVAGADPSLGYLREGMVDLLAAKLTGAGGLRAAEPRTVLSAWRRAGGAADRELAETEAFTLSRNLGAGRLIQGSLVGSSRRLTLSASLLDVSKGSAVTQATVDGPEDSLPALIDRLTAQLLTAQAGTAGSETGGLSTSLPALQAYLDGVAAYRRGRYVDAGKALNRALDADSTFAAAALMLQEAAGWEDVPGTQRADHVLAKFPERLSPRDQLLFRAAYGPNYPRAASGAELVTAAERAVAAYPDQPGAWYHLGDWYYHFGDFLGIPDARARAMAAFQRAMALDPDFSGPRQHLIDLDVIQRDTAALQQFQRQIQSDSSEGRRYYLLWRIAVAIGDSASRTRQRATLDSLAPREMFIAILHTNQDAMESVEADAVLGAYDRHANTRSERLTANYLHMIVDIPRGRPRTVVRLKAQAFQNGANPDFWDRAAVFDALYADGDTLNATQAVARLAPIADGPLARKTDDRGLQHSAACWVEQWRLAHGDTRTAARAVSRLRAAAEPGDSFSTVGEAHLCAAMLDAWVATLSRRANADQARFALDSTMRTGPPWWMPYHGATPGNHLLAHLFAAAGDTTRALAAIRRKQREWGPDVLTATRHRIEGRLAAAVGDTAGAIRAYRDYLVLRAKPDSVLIPQRDSVRSELGVLEQGAVLRESPP